MRPCSFAELLAPAAAADALVHSGLAHLEADLRQIALLALADWERQELPRPELFRAVAALQRPSWGHWNGLLTALREARKAVLRGGSAAERERVRQAATLDAVLDFLDRDAGAALTAATRPLAELVHVTLPRKPRLGALLAL